LIFFFEKVDLFRSIVENLLRWDAESLLPSKPITAFPFEDVVSAHQAIESGKTVGKLVHEV
jgi:hypothetical protein